MTADAPLLSARAVHKRFGAEPLFAGIDLHLLPRARVGLIGDNGTGKSSLLRVLCGQLAPDAGEVTRQQGVSCALLAQAPDFGARTCYQVLAEPLAPQRQALDAYAKGSAGPEAARLQAEVDALDAWQWEQRLAQAASQLRLDRLQRPAAELSGGQQKRLALAQLLLTPAQVLLLDEPTNHLDVETIAWLETYLAQAQKAVVVVTHDRTFLDNVATQMAELRDGRLSTYVGNYSDYLVARAEEEAAADRAEHRLRRHLAHELAWARRSPSARTTKSRARLERVEQAAEQLAERRGGPKLHGLELAQAPRLGREVLTLDAVEVGPKGGSLFAPLSLQLRAGERWGIVGANGTGKTSLLRAIAGEAPVRSGQLRRGKNSAVAYFDQHRKSLDPEAEVGATLTGDGSDQVVVNGKAVHVSQLLERFGFSGDVRRRRVATLSGGEKNRLALAKFFLLPVNLLLLDEPTNDLDLTTLGLLEDALLRFAGCVVVVSHDRAFLDRTCTGIVGLRPDGHGSTVHPVVVQGDYQRYHDYVRGLREAPAPASGSEAGPARPPRRRPAAPPKLTLPERRELAQMEAAIEAAEAALQAEEARLADPTLWLAGGKEGAAAAEAVAHHRAGVERLYARWQALLDKDAAGQGI